jgi:hypothetical protein
MDSSRRQARQAEPSDSGEVNIMSNETDTLFGGLARSTQQHECHVRATRFQTMLVANAASVLEKTDEQLLPSVYKYVSCSFNAGPGARRLRSTALRSVCSLQPGYNSVQLSRSASLLNNMLILFLLFNVPVQFPVFLIWFRLVSHHPGPLGSTSATGPALVQCLLPLIGSKIIFSEKLGLITASRAVCQALASGLGGYLGYHYNRKQVIAAGCFIWGTMTMLFSFTHTWYWGAFIWAWNGVGLAFLIPNTQSLVADYYEEFERGQAFGTLYTTGVAPTSNAPVASPELYAFHPLQPFYAPLSPPVVGKGDSEEQPEWQDNDKA